MTGLTRLDTPFYWFEEKNNLMYFVTGTLGAEIDDSHEEMVRKEVSTFDKFKRAEVTIEKANNKTIIRDCFIITIDGKTEIVEDTKNKNAKLLALLKKATNSIKIKDNIGSKELDGFLACVNKLEVQKSLATDCFCYINGKFRTQHKLYQEVFEKEDNTVIRKWIRSEPQEYYSTFQTFPYDPSVAKQVIEHINTKLKRISKDGRDEREYIKLIIAWTIAGIIKFELRRLGVGCFPLLWLVGVGNTGKTTRASLFSDVMYNSIKKDPGHLEGSFGARLQDCNPDTYPLFFDEITKLPKHNTMKVFGTSGELKIPKGNKGGGHREPTIFKPLILASNFANISDPALKSRITFLDYNGFDNNDLPENTFDFLQDNIIHLGCGIRNYIEENLNVEEKVTELRGKHVEHKGRDMDKMLYYKIGEFVCDDIGILPDVKIGDDLILHGDVDQVVDKTKALKQVIDKIILSSELRYSNHIATVGSTLRNKVLTKEEYNHFDNRGIYFTSTFKGIYIGKNMLSKINDELHRIGIPPVTKLNLLAEEIGKTYQSNNPVKIICEGDEGGATIKTTKRCFMYCTAHELNDEEEENE